MGLFDRFLNADTLRLLPKHDRAVELYDQKNYKGALAILNELIAERPDFRQYYTSRGTVYEDMYNDNMAEKDFKKAIELEPNDALSQYRLGMLYHRKNDLESAVKHLRIAYEHHHSYDDLLGPGLYNNILWIHKRNIACNLGNFLTQLDQFSEGYRILDEVIQNCPTYSFPYYAKALALARQNKFKEALMNAKKAEQYGHPSAPQLRSTLELALNTTPRDKYSKMIDEAKINPLHITNDPQFQSHRLPDLTDVFRRELIDLVDNPYMREFGYRGVIGGYAYNMITSYYNNAGFVPKTIVDQILEMVYNAIKTSQYSFMLESLEELKEGVYPQLFTEDID